MFAIVRIIWFYSFLFVCVSCSEESKNNDSILEVKVGQKDFPSTVTLQKEEILKGDSFHHHKVYILDTILLTTSNSGRYHYHAYHTKTLEYLGSLGVRGEGPEEWVMPQTTEGQYEKRGNEIFLWIFDFMRGHLSKVNITESLKIKADNPVITKRIRIDSRSFPFFRLFYVNEEKIIADCWITEQDRARIKSYNPKIEETEKSKLFPSIKNIELLPAEIINSLYTTTFSKHPSKNLFVQAMATFNRIDILDDELELKKSIVDGENWKDDYYDAKEIDPATNFLEDKIDGYNGTAVTEDFIFALEMNVIPKNETNRLPKSYIRVFDWRGTPICLLHFENHLNAIGVDDSNGYIYATDYENELVLRYDINQHIKAWKR